MANMDQSYLIELDSNLSPTLLIRQLILRLQSYNISKAARPIRMNEPIEIGGEEEANNEHFVDHNELEEAMNGLSVKKRVTPKYKWRRSKCGFYCPVNLKDGKIVSGKPEYAAAFLDKIYLMSDEQSLRTFLKNPRPYLRLPQPRAPCKLSILGTSFTGKTSLSSLLAKKYNAKVIDMKSLIEPEIIKSREELIASTRREAMQSTMDQIKFRLKEKLEAEKAQREVEQAEKAAAALQEQEQEQQLTEDQEHKTEDTSKAYDNEQTSNKTEIAQQDLTYFSIKTDKYVFVNEADEIVVSEEHPDVQAAIERALDEVNKTVGELPASDYIRVLQNELEKLRKERAKLDSTAPSDGGWILDNFPNNQDQLNAMVANNIIPDTFIILQDASEELTVLTKRWYNLNRQEIDQQIEKRLVEEEKRKAEQLKK
jgi:adenylate/nucleoside-diphosphate kinase